MVEQMRCGDGEVGSLGFNILASGCRPAIISKCCPLLFGFSTRRVWRGWVPSSSKRSTSGWRNSCNPSSSHWQTSSTGEEERKRETVSGWGLGLKVGGGVVSSSWVGVCIGTAVLNTRSMSSEVKEECTDGMMG